MSSHYTIQKTIVAQLVTPDNFKKFGGVISSAHQLSTAQSSSANYGTAVKLFQVSPIINRHEEAQANFNLFRCSPPKHLIDDHSEVDGGLTYHSKVLERHPFSTQTFIPMGRPRDDISYMVIVAPPDPEDPRRLPKIDKVEAFLVNGDQAITYGVGIWHAPMIALGDTTDFAVLIHETGISKQDTEEVSIDELQVEFTLTETTPVINRKPQTEEDFAEEQNLYNGPSDPTKDMSLLDETGDIRFDSKQSKYRIEREYYLKNYAEVIKLVDGSKVDGKLQKELFSIRSRAEEKLAKLEDQ